MKLLQGGPVQNRLTGLDFNSLLDDAVEDDIEDDVERMLRGCGNGCRKVIYEIQTLI